MAFLYDTLVQWYGLRNLTKVIVPSTISDNIRKEFVIRPYQIEAFQRFLVFWNEEYDSKGRPPYHLLYNMATGSGKTLIMAGLILYLYECGYRNFLFFVNSNNIIDKTKSNFLNSKTSKYLFNEKITIQGKEIKIKECENFESSDVNNINIKFTTIQQLHIDLNNSKENSITIEDFKTGKVVLIADEAHHLSSATRSKGELFGSWEGTVINILKQNIDNLLLEFTATLDYEIQEIVKKYQDKVIFRYDLAQFRKDKYSKEIDLIRSFFDEKDRILQACILNLYRQELATFNNINLKPVILFKAKKTIKESEENKEKFHKIMEELTTDDVNRIYETTSFPIVKKAFSFFSSHNITFLDIVSRLKYNFKRENCLSANNDAEAAENQIRLNTLEDENNPIRAIFAVHKLNEGWDVLNLFDIVRLYEGQNSGGSNTTIGATTMSEAQLIGRGARYFPFTTEVGQDKYVRKYDTDETDDFRVLEELYYHTKEESRYIYELKKALKLSGIYDDNDDYEYKSLELKPDFLTTSQFATGRVFFNKKIIRNYSKIRSFSDLGVVKKNFSFTLSSGLGKVTSAFDSESVSEFETDKWDIKISSIPIHLVRFSLSQNPFFYFSKLKKYFPNINSLSHFIESPDYLGGLELTIVGYPGMDRVLSSKVLLSVFNALLQNIEIDIKSHLTEFEGSEFISDYVRNIFKNKILKIKKGDVRLDGQEGLLADKSWYAYNANYGTTEEKDFVDMFARKFSQLQIKFTDIYLIRNERELKIFDKQGRPFEPDFILFCKSIGTEELIYQIFIEPKGIHLKGYDKWKEEFLKEIRLESKTFNVHTDNYLITGVPFYNNRDENEFIKSFDSVLDNVITS